MKQRSWLVPLAGLRPGENRLSYELGPEELGITEHEVAENPSFDSLLGDVRVELVVHKTGRRLLVDGRVSFRARLTCAMCGTEFEREFDERLPTQLVDPGDKRVERSGGFGWDEPDRALICGDLLDLRMPVRDVVHLAVPMAPSCRKGCRGVCPVCGQDLNREQCRCARDTEQVQSPLSGLAALKRPGKNGSRD